MDPLLLFGGIIIEDYDGCSLVFPDMCEVLFAFMTEDVLMPVF
jgi:hypothetical protein